MRDSRPSRVFQRVRRRVALGLVFVVGCRRAPADHRAEVPIGSPAPAPAEVSQFSAPLIYDFDPVLRVVERVVPTTFGSLDSVHQIANDERRHYSFDAERGPFTAQARDSLVYLRATLRYAARGYYNAPTGPTLRGGGGGDSVTRPRVVVEIAAPLTLDSTWHLQSKAMLVSVEPA